MDLRLVNLETAITTHPHPWPKGINYRMHPDNLPFLQVAGLDCAVLANNPVFLWDRQGLLDTLAHLRQAGIGTAGSGRDAREAAAPAILQASGAHLLGFAMGHRSAGISPEWAAGPAQPDVHLLEELSPQTLARFAEQLFCYQRPGDLLLTSLHWGGNWGYAVPPDHRRFAHALLDLPPHPRPFLAPCDEIRDGRPIPWRCGDFRNDYEGIEGDAEFRGDLAVAWLPQFRGPPWQLASFEAAVFRIRRMPLKRAPAADRDWLCARLARESGRFGVQVEAGASNRLHFLWQA